MSRTSINREARIEDLRWLAETGENAHGAAARLGTTFMALEKWAKRECPDAWRALLSRDAHDPNFRTGGKNQWTA